MLTVPALVLLALLFWCLRHMVALYERLDDQELLVQSLINQNKQLKHRLAIVRRSRRARELVLNGHTYQPIELHPCTRSHQLRGLWALWRN